MPTRTVTAQGQIRNKSNLAVELRVNLFVNTLSDTGVFIAQTGALALTGAIQPGELSSVITLSKAGIDVPEGYKLAMWVSVDMISPVARTEVAKTSTYTYTEPKYEFEIVGFLPGAQQLQPDSITSVMGAITPVMVIGVIGSLLGKLTKSFGKAS